MGRIVLRRDLLLLLRRIGTGVTGDSRRRVQRTAANVGNTNAIARPIAGVGIAAVVGRVVAAVTEAVSQTVTPSQPVGEPEIGAVTPTIDAVAVAESVAKPIAAPVQESGRIAQSAIETAAMN